MDLDKLYIYTNFTAHRDLLGAVGYLRPKRPGFQYQEFVSFNTVVMVDPEEDVRKLNWRDCIDVSPR